LAELAIRRVGHADILAQQSFVQTRCYLESQLAQRVVIAGEVAVRNGSPSAAGQSRQPLDKRLRLPSTAAIVGSICNPPLARPNRNSASVIGPDPAQQEILSQANKA
jgi:hypothetical protein